jgi:hypothetical protein
MKKASQIWQRKKTTRSVTNATIRSIQKKTNTTAHACIVFTNFACSAMECSPIAADAREHFVIPAWSNALTAGKNFARIAGKWKRAEKMKKEIRCAYLVNDPQAKQEE